MGATRTVQAVSVGDLAVPSSVRARRTTLASGTKKSRVWSARRTTGAPHAAAAARSVIAHPGVLVTSTSPSLSGVVMVESWPGGGSASNLSRLTDHRSASAQNNLSLLTR